MYFGMKCLDPAVHHLGKTGITRHLGEFYPGFCEGFPGSTGTHDAVFLLAQRFCKLDDASLVPDGEECPLHG